MTELMETIAIGIVDEDDWECPFDHELLDPPDVKNDLYGDGQTLASQMSKKPVPVSTYRFKKLDSQYKLKDKDRVMNPRKEKEGDLYGENKPIKVLFERTEMLDGKPTLRDEEVQYPLSVAAHHCIPAQASLKRCEIILAYMVKKGEEAGLKLGKSDSDFSDGRVWANVGYDVNGLQNGIYLPGNYAVTKGEMKKWHPNAAADDGEGTQENADEKSDWLTGTPDDGLNKKNTCWQYVDQAVHYGKGQFHDSHEPYSNFVLKVLEAIGEDMVRLEDAVFEGNCEECGERIEQFCVDGKGAPTDHELVTKLNKLSRNLTAYINGSGWHREIYTSRWMDAYMTKIKFAKKKT